MSFKDLCIRALKFRLTISPSRHESQPGITNAFKDMTTVAFCELLNGAAMSSHMEFVPRPLGDLVSSPVFILGAVTAQDRPLLLGELCQAEMSCRFLHDMGMFGKEAC